MAFSDPRAGRRAQPGMADTGWMVATGALCMVLVLAGVWAGTGLLTAPLPAGTGLVDVFVLQGRGTVPAGRVIRASWRAPAAGPGRGGGRG